MGVSTELVDHHLHGLIEIGPDAVELVDESDPRYPVLIGLVPCWFRLWLDTFHAGEDRDHAVEHPERALHLDRKVHVTGRVDDLYLVIVPVGGGDGRGDSDAAFLLLRSVSMTAVIRTRS